MRIAELPLHRRPRERLAQEGAGSLSVRDLVAVLIGSGSSNRSVERIAEDVDRLLTGGQPSFEALRYIPGIGPAKATLLCAAIELGSRLERSDPRMSFLDADEVYAACADILEQPQENVVVLYLDVRNRARARETVSIGTVSSSIVHPRDVFRAAIAGNASGIILAHNHPSGDPTPSHADIDVTRRIAESGRQLGIPLLDHVVCARRGFVSLRG